MKPLNPLIYKASQKIWGGVLHQGRRNGVGLNDAVSSGASERGR